MMPAFRYITVYWTAVISGLFSIVVCLLLLLDFSGRGQVELLDTPAYLSLKEQLADEPTNEALQGEIRQLDLTLREDYFRRRRFTRMGIYLLLGGAIVTFATARWAAALRQLNPEPKSADGGVDLESQQQLWGRWATVGLMLALLATMTVVTLRTRTSLPPTLADLQPAAASSSDEQGLSSDNPFSETDTKRPSQPVPDREQYLAQWPRFRGPDGSGICRYADMPDSWDVSSGEGVLWKSEVPLPGLNSPVVWNDFVFLSGATSDELAVFCFQTADGQMKWRYDVASQAPPMDEPLEVNEDTGYAAPTVATDGLRVYAIFAIGDLVALDFDGQLVWQKHLGVPDNPYGHASSLATYDNLVFVQFDQGTKTDGKSKLFAFDGASGDVVWEVVREVPGSWSSPIVVDTDAGPIVITTAAPWVTAYAALDGKELWRVECLHDDVGPSPVFREDRVYAANESGGLFVIRSGGSGDVTDSHVAWSTDIDVPDVSSPLVSDKFVFMITHGLMGCWDVAGGEEPLWQEDMGDEVSSSPSQVGENIYVFTDGGPALIVKPAAEQCEIVAELDMGESCRTSPAFQPGRIYIRGETHLFCLGAE
jgi:outer membrane protein assembly factor BamB